MFTHSKKPPLVGRLVPTGPDRARAVNTCLHRRLDLALSPPSLRPLLEPPLFSSPPFAGLPPSTMPLLDLPMPSPPPSVSLPHRLHPCLSSISAAFYDRILLAVIFRHLHPCHPSPGPNCRASSRMEARIGETASAILLHPPLPAVGVSIATERGCQDARIGVTVSTCRAHSTLQRRCGCMALCTRHGHLYTTLPHSCTRLPLCTQHCPLHGKGTVYTALPHLCVHGFRCVHGTASLCVHGLRSSAPLGWLGCPPPAALPPTRRR